MVEQETYVLMPHDTKVKKITGLIPNEGLDYAQWGSMMVASGFDFFYPKNILESNKEPISQPVFWIEKLQEDDTFNPVFGLKKKDEQQ